MGVKLYLSVSIVFLVSLISAEQCIHTYYAYVKGTVNSSFYGQRPYPTPSFCQYNIIAPRGQRIKLTFKDFDVYPTKGCNHLLKVQGNEGRTLAFMCGRLLPRPILSEKGESLILIFSSDFVGSGRGFLLEYESGPDLQICQPGESLCANRNCFTPDLKCDGWDDCGDATDEEDCNHPIAVLPEDCGKQTIKPKFDHDRIVNGEEVVPNSWPWQVSVNNAKGNTHSCGGTLISTQWILTAAHCTENEYNPGDLTIVLGAHNLLNSTKYQQTRRSAKVIGYPDHMGKQIANYKLDIALIKLNAPVTLNAGVQPACLPDFDFTPPAGWKCYATGWGETRGSGGSELLNQLLVTVKPKEICFNDTGICIWNANSGTCQGDSGGPLQCRIGETWYVFGALSHNYADNFFFKDETLNKKTSICGVGTPQSIYASIVGKVDWIKETIEKYS